MQIDFKAHFSGSNICEVLTDPDSLEFFGGDIMGRLATPMAVLRPKTQNTAVEIVDLCRRAKVAICPRGGGASYTYAHVPNTDASVIVDMELLGGGVKIDDVNMTVTVEPGVTWRALDDALKPHGLRTPFWGPFSGLKSTIGGSLSQHAISLGSGHYDNSSTIVTGLKVVTGAGDVIDTGTTPSRFYRAYGPDLTGLFLGDSGAFGLKLEITLRLMRRPTALEATCVAYETFEDMAEAMMAVSKLNVASEILAVDPALQQGQLGAMNKSDLLTSALAVFKSAPGPISGLKSLIATAFSTRSFLKKPCFLAMYMTEGQSRAEAVAKLASLRKLARQGGAETGNGLALAMRGEPFQPFTVVLGPKGERWLPLHAVLQYGNVEAFHKDLAAYYEAIALDLEKHNAYIATMFLTVAQNGFVYEPTLLWRDSRHAVHKRLAPPEHLENLPVHADNEAAREFAFNAKKDIIALMQKHGAAHYQLGKTYPFLSNREEGAKALFTDLKNRFDPDNIMNPGALEF